MIRNRVQPRLSPGQGRP